jgi:hypothetical protein
MRNMKEVTKNGFKKIYFELGGGRDGWDAAYWKRTFEDNPRPGMRFMVEEPARARDTTMWIVSDFAANEYRLFFRSAEESDGMLVFPGTDD